MLAILAMLMMTMIMAGMIGATAVRFRLGFD